MKLELCYITKREHSNYTEIIMLCRTKEGIRYKISIKDFEPYFYVPLSELDPDLIERLKKEGLIKRVELTSLKSLDGKDVAKIVCYRAVDVPKVREHFKQTYEADVPFVVRFMIDKGIKNGIEVAKVADVLSHKEVKGW